MCAEDGSGEGEKKTSGIRGRNMGHNESNEHPREFVSVIDPLLFFGPAVITACALISTPTKAMIRATTSRRIVGAAIAQRAGAALGVQKTSSLCGAGSNSRNVSSGPLPALSRGESTRCLVPT